MRDSSNDLALSFRDESGDIDPKVVSEIQRKLEWAESQLETIRAEHKIKFEKHAHCISIAFMYIVLVLFIVLILWLIGYTILASLSNNHSIQNLWYGVILSFLSGALGAGFGDSIFKRIKKHWDE